MVSVAEFTIPSTALPFGRVLDADPEIRIDVQRIVPSGETAFPFFWVRNVDPETFRRSVADEPEVEELQLLDALDGASLFRATWSSHAKIIRGLERVDGSILETSGTGERWRFRIAAERQATFMEIHELFNRYGIPASLDRLSNVASVIRPPAPSLTDHQRETVTAAYRQGYFDSPRGVTQAELGDQFGISHRAVSERLRRGIRNLVAASVRPSTDS